MVEVTRHRIYGPCKLVARFVPDSVLTGINKRKIIMTQLSKTGLSHSLEIFLSHIPPQGPEVDEKEFSKSRRKILKSIGRKPAEINRSS